MRKVRKSKRVETMLDVRRAQILAQDGLEKGEKALCSSIQIPTRIPEKIVVALFSGILVNYGIVVVTACYRQVSK